MNSNMNIRKVLGLISGLTFLMSLPASAQGTTLFGGVSLPVGDFVEDDGFDRRGLARTGFTGGLQSNVVVGPPALAWSSELSLIYHPFDVDEAETVLPTSLARRMEGGGYFAVPLLTGLRFNAPISSQLQLFAVGQAGANFLMQNELRGQVGGGSAWMDFETSIAPAFAAGGGLVFDRRYEIAVRFLHLGRANYDYEAGGDGGPWIDGRRRFDIQAWRFTLGYSL